MSNTELKDIARSISSWTYAHRNNFRKRNEGAMGFPTMKGQLWTQEEHAKEVGNRRKLAAHRTNKMRRGLTREKIIDGIGQCLSNKIEPTAKNISSLSGVPLRTVYNHKDLIAG